MGCGSVFTTAGRSPKRLSDHHLTSGSCLVFIFPDKKAVSALQL